jgi:ADP-ribose pyrophosphatase
MRETAEETGYTFKSFQHLGKVAGNPGILNNFTHIYLALDGEKTTATAFDAQEDLKTLLLDIKEIKSLMQENKIIQSLHLNACYMALEKIK